MNTFQLLKSGTSFKKDRIQKVALLFHPQKSDQPKLNEMTEEMEKIRGADFRSIPVDTQIVEIDKKIEEVTAESLSAKKHDEKIAFS
jgi:hypothetical protein